MFVPSVISTNIPGEDEDDVADFGNDEDDEGDNDDDFVYRISWKPPGKSLGIKTKDLLYS